MPLANFLTGLSPLGPTAATAGEAAAGLFSKGGSAVNTGPTSVSTRNPVNVAPVGVNLGAIMQPYQTGSAVNGGPGFSAETPGSTLKVGAPAGGFTLPLIVGGVAVGGVLLVLLLRR